MKKILFTLLAICTSASSFAQDLIVTNTGNSFSAYNLDTSSESYIYYQLSEADTSTVLRINKKDVLIIKKADGTKYDPAVPNSIIADNKTPISNNFPDIDLSLYKGSLFNKGNCVFVTSNSNVPYELSAVERIKARLNDLGYWQIVDKPSQAHFVVQYGVDLEGRDKAFLFIRTTKSYSDCSVMKYKYKIPQITSIVDGYYYTPILFDYVTSVPESFILSIQSSDEDINGNIAVVDKMFKKDWPKFEKIIFDTSLDLTIHNNFKVFMQYNK